MARCDLMTRPSLDCAFDRVCVTVDRSCNVPLCPGAGTRAQPPRYSSAAVAAAVAWRWDWGLRALRQRPFQQPRTAERPQRCTLPVQTIEPSRPGSPWRRCGRTAGRHRGVPPPCARQMLGCWVLGRLRPPHGGAHGAGGCACGAALMAGRARSWTARRAASLVRHRVTPRGTALLAVCACGRRRKPA